MLTDNFLLALLLASLFLNLCIFLSRVTARTLKVNQEVPAEVFKLKGTSLSEVWELVLQAELWEVVLPIFVYSLIYSYLPSSGIKAGLCLGLIIFTLGTLPNVIDLGNTLKLPISVWLHQLVWRLIRTFLVFGTFGYFFN